METGTIKDELYIYFCLSDNSMTVPIQQKSKIKHQTFKYVLLVFNKKYAVGLNDFYAKNRELIKK